MFALHSSARVTLAALASLSLAALGSASTYVVDSSGGVGSDFTDIPPAIAAAQPGDVLLVLSGNYSGFTLDKPIAILGQAADVNVNGGASVTAIPSGTVASVVTLKLAGSLQVTNCSGTVVCDGLVVGAFTQIAGSADVRLRFITGVTPPILDGLAVNSSRVEVVDSTFRGAKGHDLNGCSSNQAEEGGAGADITSGEVHFARCNLYGGQGGAGGTCIDPGLCPDGRDGGQGIRLETGAQSLVTGLSEFVVGGGPGGAAACGNPGGPGFSIYLAPGSAVRYSGESVSSVINFGGTIETPSPADPSMRILETPVPGGNLTFRVNAPVGSSVKLDLGRHAIVQDVPGLAEDVLVHTNRVFNLGVVPASGVVSFNFPLAASWPKGFTIFFQAVVTLPDTTIRYTHSIPVVLR
jgi:hypothetical protein